MPMQKSIIPYFIILIVSFVLSCSNKNDEDLSAIKADDNSIDGGLLNHDSSLLPFDISSRDQQITGDVLKQGDAAAPSHYFDSQGQPLPQFNFIWEKVYAYYGSDTPPKITIKYIAEEGGMFDPSTYSILISQSFQGQRAIGVIAHESAHLGLFNLTRGASVMEPFRFFDEGYNTIVGYTIEGLNMNKYKTTSLGVARIQDKMNNLSFAQVQKWDEYFGTDPSNANWYAYYVGSSFVYFIIDTYSEKKLFEFFQDIGITKDLGQTFKNLFNATVDEIEKQWKDYLLAKVPDEMLAPPKVVEMSPAHEATNVSRNLTEVYAKFDKSMTTDQICVLTPCQDTGVCYTNAYWKDSKTLAIKVTNLLKAKYNYRLQLGSTSGCQLISAIGVPLPITPWNFTTQE